MRGFSKILVMCAVLLATHGYFIQPAFANAELLAKIETQIAPDSDSETIKKLQTLFNKLGLYNGEVDGIYKSIESDIIHYQIQAGIITNKDSYGAGYFGKKTIAALQKDFPEKFTQTATETISKEEMEHGERKFVVTAYYSPLKGQSRYVTGSYRWDIRLNWNGTHGASGQAVHPWFLAAPRNYDFGTKIYFEGLGVWVVEDRWGAIVNAGRRGHSYDRIDIWMWYGDEGRLRAIKWWKRTVVGEILPSDSEVTIAFSNSPINKYLDLKINGANPNPENVKKLQELFKEIGRYNGQIDGNFDNISDILIDFQVKKSIISSANSPEAGYFWPKTLAALREEYEKDIEYNTTKKTVVVTQLSARQKKSLDKTIEKIEAYLKKKSSWDDELYEKLNKKIKDRVIKLIAKQTKKIKKLQLEYLVNNL